MRRLDDAQHPVAQRARPRTGAGAADRPRQKLEIESGDWVRVSSARGELEVKALVTPRMKALKIGDQEVTVVWMPYNWGFQGCRPARASTTSRSTPRILEREPRRPRRASSTSSRPAARPREDRITEGTHMSEAAATGPIRTTLIDIANCIGCRACQVACKQWNERTARRPSWSPTGLPEPGDAQREDLHAHRVPRDGERGEAEAWNPPS